MGTRTPGAEPGTTQEAGRTSLPAGCIRHVSQPIDRPCTRQRHSDRAVLARYGPPAATDFREKFLNRARNLGPYTYTPWAQQAQPDTPGSRSFRPAVTCPVTPDQKSLRPQNGFRVPVRPRMLCCLSLPVCDTPDAYPATTFGLVSAPRGQSSCDRPISKPGQTYAGHGTRRNVTTR